jgi:hypothetical protein
MSHKFLVVSLSLSQHWKLQVLTKQDQFYDELADGTHMGVCKDLVLPHVSPALQALEVDPLNMLCGLVPQLGVLLWSGRSNTLLLSPSCGRNLAASINDFES